MVGKSNEKASNRKWQWTNQRHVNFLNSMEASFVHSMLHNHDQLIHPLDRYLPDISDSTKDLGLPTTTHASLSDNVNSSGRRTNRKPRNLACQKSSQDQVVPEFENKGDDKDKDDRDDVSLRTVH